MKKALLVIIIITITTSYGMSQNMNWSINKDHSKIYFKTNLDAGFQSLTKFKNTDEKVLVSSIDYSNSLNKFALNLEEIDNANATKDSFLRSTNYFILENKLKGYLRMVF